MKKVSDVNEAIEASSAYKPEPSALSINIPFDLLEANGFIVEKHPKGITLHTDKNLAGNEEWYEAKHELANAGNYEYDSLARTLLFEAIDKAEMQIRLIDAISGKGCTI
jgi:hypothetical protein